jgi:signal transduction histidine kinase
MRHRAKQINSELHFLSKKEGTRIWLEIQKSNT